MGKLQINDSAFVYQAESSVALGYGFDADFLVVPYGDRAGAVAPGVRYGHYRDLPERRLRGGEDQRRLVEVDNPSICLIRASSRRSGNRLSNVS